MHNCTIGSFFILQIVKLFFICIGLVFGLTYTLLCLEKVQKLALRIMYGGETWNTKYEELLTVFVLPMLKRLEESVYHITYTL